MGMISITHCIDTFYVATIPTILKLAAPIYRSFDFMI